MVPLRWSLEALSIRSHFQAFTFFPWVVISGVRSFRPVGHNHYFQNSLFPIKATGTKSTKLNILLHKIKAADTWKDKIGFGAQHHTSRVCWTLPLSRFSNLPLRLHEPLRDLSLQTKGPQQRSRGKDESKEKLNIQRFNTKNSIIGEFLLSRLETLYPKNAVIDRLRSKYAFEDTIFCGGGSGLGGGQGGQLEENRTERYL